MRVLRGLLLVLVPLTVAAQDDGRVIPDDPIACDACAGWNADRQPFQVFGNTYSVGVGGLSAVLIVSEAGHILLDGGLPQSAVPIAEHIRALGFRTADVRLILNSHAHFDHAGGIAALQRASGAAVAASASGARALARGGPVEDDPQRAFGDRFPSVAQVRVVEDGETLRVGALAVTAHLTPGHTPGSTAWTWRSCAGDRCLDVVYADSLNAVSAPGFRFTGTDERSSVVETFRHSIDVVERLPCDILLSVHPEFSNVDAKVRLRAEGGTPDPFIDPGACRAYAAAARRSLERRVAEEQ